MNNHKQLALAWRLYAEDNQERIPGAAPWNSPAGYPDNPGAWKIVDYPASYHNLAGGLSFADGHSEIRKWVDPRTMPCEISP